MSDFKSKKKENDQNFARNPFLRIKLHTYQFEMYKIYLFIFLNWQLFDRDSDDYDI